MNDSNPTPAEILSLPNEVRTASQQSWRLLLTAREKAALLKKVDREKLARLELSNDRKFDVALNFALTMASSETWVEDHFFYVRDKLDELEKQVANRRSGIALVDLTSQATSPPCLGFVAIEIPSKPALQYVAAPGYFHDIPVSVRLPGRLLFAANSNYLLMSVARIAEVPRVKRTYSHDGKWLTVERWRRQFGKPITTTIDISQLIHPNWNARRVKFAGILFGEKAIRHHLAEWRKFARTNALNDWERTQVLKFLDEFITTLFPVQSAKMAKSA